MKRFLFSMLAAVLLVCMLSVQVFAEGDVVIKNAKIYADRAMTRYIGMIRAYTSVVVNPYSGKKFYTEAKKTEVKYNGMICYMNTSDLFKDDYSILEERDLPKGTKVYQRPSTLSRSKTLKSDQSVYVCAVNFRWTLVRTTDYDFCGYYGFIRNDN